MEWRTVVVTKEDRQGEDEMPKVELLQHRASFFSPGNSPAREFPRIQLAQKQDKLSCNNLEKKGNGYERCKNMASKEILKYCVRRNKIEKTPNRDHEETSHRSKTGSPTGSEKEDQKEGSRRQEG
jgi:hypothetical protein